MDPTVYFRTMPLFGQEKPEAVMVNGASLSCVICKHDTFFERRAQLHGPVATLFNLEWAAPTATCVVCSQCGYVHWFLQT